MATSQPDPTLAILMQYKAMGADTIFLGPQGALLPKFIELSLPATKTAHFIKDDGFQTLAGGILNKKVWKWVSLIDGGDVGGLDYGHVYALSDAGVLALKAGAGATQVLEVHLRCSGSYLHGRQGKIPGPDGKDIEIGTGSNCQRSNEANPAYCSELGNSPCSPTCAHLLLYKGHTNGCPRDQPGSRSHTCIKGCQHTKSKEQQTRAASQHGCSFTVVIAASLRDISNGLRWIRLDGSHVPDGTLWQPPTAFKPAQACRILVKESLPILHGSGLGTAKKFVHKNAASTDGAGVYLSLCGLLTWVLQKSE